MRASAVVVGASPLVMPSRLRLSLPGCCLPPQDAGSGMRRSSHCRVITPILDALPVEPTAVLRCVMYLQPLRDGTRKRPPAQRPRTARTAMKRVQVVHQQHYPLPVGIVLAPPVFAPPEPNRAGCRRSVTSTRRHPSQCGADSIEYRKGCSSRRSYS